MSRTSSSVRPARRTKLFPTRTMTSLLTLLAFAATFSNVLPESAINPVGSIVGSGSGVSSSSGSSSSSSSSSVIGVVSDSSSSNGNGVGGVGSGNGVGGVSGSVGGSHSVINGGGGGGSHSGIGGSNAGNGKGRCEEITIPMCRGIGYNLTAMPNELNHDTQDEAGLEVHQFWPLVEIKCSADLKFFLCSMYAPICLPEYTKPLPACRSVCERARTGCAPLMQQYGFSWPERMACERLPYHGAISAVSSSVIGGTGNTGGASAGGAGLAGIAVSGIMPAPAPPSMGGIGRSIIQEIAGVQNCALPCRGAFLTNEEREFAAVWLALWSGLCAASTLVTVITFLIDTQRFKYPERPIVFLSACYFVVSLGYLSRSVFGHEEIACDGPALKSGAQGPGACVTVFLLIYFFGMASSVWWVILAFTWFLAAGLKWGNEAIASYSQYFHLVAWLAPTVQTVWAYVAGGVAGDPVAGVCTVAPEGVRNFILAPLFVYLLLGTTFLLAGFVSLFRIRSVIKRQPGAKADKLEKLMIRIGVFSVLYTLPASVVLGCHMYESALRDEWLSSLACPCHPRTRPLYSILMLKYFMALAVGITSGVWIWSGKTVDSWKRLWRRLFGGDRSHMGAGAGMVAGVTGVGSGIGSSIGIKGGIVGRGIAMPYPSAPGPGSALLPPGSVASASQHHLHHHVLKQPPLSHV
ncbi:Frizzled-5 [Trachymyrmex septentrionalis]|uniref:Frizzled-5 n=1 Tax=Trachymyrmex septentrionalis TaxID=34720 RepID=A0A195ETD1_9HYME|nr:Frizzled-5 [Trachymyrmex septentrionalis]